MSNEKLVHRWIDIWKPRLLLQKWGMTVRCMDKDIEQPNGRPMMACCIVDSQNSEAQIRLYPKLWLEPKGYQEISLVHEMAHVYTDPAREALELAVQEEAITKERATQIIEDLTNDIAKIAWKAHTKGRKDKGNYHL